MPPPAPDSKQPRLRAWREVMVDGGDSQEKIDAELSQIAADASVKAPPAETA